MNIYKVAFAVHYVVDHKLLENLVTGNKTCESRKLKLYTVQLQITVCHQKVSDPNGLMSVQILPVIRPLCPNILKQVKVTVAVLQSTYLIGTC